MRTIEETESLPMMDRLAAHDEARLLLDGVAGDGSIREGEISAALYIAYLEFLAESYWDLAESVRRVHDRLFRYGISR